MKLRIATCARLPEPDRDAEPFAAALVRAGIDAELVAWDDPAADWSGDVPTLIRSTWNYALDVRGFLAWAARVRPLWNPLAVIEENVFKRYLLALAARGVPVIPTVMLEAVPDALPALGDRIVVKPEVGAGSLGARVFAAGDAAALAHVRELLARSAVLVQPYVASVGDYGERSLVWIDGEFTHAIRKSPRLAGDSEAVTGPFAIAPDEHAVAEAAIAPYASQILYGRVDLARDDAGQPRVMELELVEPSLFFSANPPSADRFAAAIARAMLSPQP
ncbi:MAG TPA: hypothetical protein VGM88_30095 [Kofleriaceae bacterium]